MSPENYPEETDNRVMEKLTLLYYCSRSARVRTNMQVELHGSSYIYYTYQLLLNVTIHLLTARISSIACS